MLAQLFWEGFPRGLEECLWEFLDIVPEVDLWGQKLMMDWFAVSTLVLDWGQDPLETILEVVKPHLYRYTYWAVKIDHEGYRGGRLYRGKS